jgi:hypothetical protein
MSNAQQRIETGDAMAKESRNVPEYFQWNHGAWFGGQLGGTAWMAAGAVALWPKSVGMAGTWLACCAAANAIGLVLWQSRGRIRTHAAMQILLAACGVFGMIAWTTLVRLQPDLADAFGWPGESNWGFLAFLIVPAIMAWFAVLDWRMRSRTR